MPEKFLIVGASSFYGSTFMEYARQRGDEVQTVNHRLGEFLDYERTARDKTVVNFASNSLVAESWERPWEWMQTNATDTTSFVWMMREAGPKRFVHVSTPEVYGDTGGWVDEEFNDWRPSTPYACSRAAGDMMLKAYHRAFGFPVIITRTANIYGPEQGKNRFIPLAFDTLRRGEKLLLHGGGSTVRCFIHAWDACAALYRVAKEGSIGQTYHISTTYETSILQLAKKICRLVGADQKLIGSQPDRRGKDQHYLLRSDRIRRMGWRDTITLDKGLEEYARARPLSEVP